MNHNKRVLLLRKEVPQESAERKADNPTQRFVDNKRKMLEKDLSGCQWDQVYMNLARDELKLKQNMVDGLTVATQESTKAFEQISKSIASIGQSIGDGLALLAQALGGALGGQQQPNQYFNPLPSMPLQSRNMPYGAEAANCYPPMYYHPSPASSSNGLISSQPHTPASTRYSQNSAEQKTYENL